MIQAQTTHPAFIFNQWTFSINKYFELWRWDLCGICFHSGRHRYHHHHQRTSLVFVLSLLSFYYIHLYLKLRWTLVIQIQNERTHTTFSCFDFIYRLEIVLSQRNAHTHAERACHQTQTTQIFFCCQYSLIVRRIFAKKPAKE